MEDKGDDKKGSKKRNKKNTNNKREQKKDEAWKKELPKAGGEHGREESWKIYLQLVQAPYGMDRPQAR